MLEKIKQALLFIVLPVTVVLGFIFHLFTRISDLKQKVAEGKVEKDLIKVTTKLSEKEHESNQSEADYNALRDKYLREHPDSKS